MAAGRIYEASPKQIDNAILSGKAVPGFPETFIVHAALTHEGRKLEANFYAIWASDGSTVHLERVPLRLAAVADVAPPEPLSKSQMERGAKTELEKRGGVGTVSYGGLPVQKPEHGRAWEIVVPELPLEDQAKIRERIHSIRAKYHDLSVNADIRGEDPPRSP